MNLVSFASQHLHNKVEPLNNRHIRGRDVVLCWEVVGYQATTFDSDVEYIARCGLLEVESAIFMQTHQNGPKIE